MDFQSKSNELKCPRCNSLDTKFCYYNNYNYSQPRHFCKTCRRYWTLGGLLRNVPVGGGIRKSKKNSKPKRAILTDSVANPNSCVEMLSTPWYGWIENGRGFEDAAAAEGFGSLDDLGTSGGNEGMVEISGGVAVDNGGSWLKFYGLTPPFNN